MRMIKKFAQLDNERGAATAMVAISLIAIMGMVVLVVDVGGLLTLRRRIVAASDAAALAAAQSCARDMSGEVLAKADEFATENVAEATRYAFEEEGCGGGTGSVTVGYQANKQLFFAPLLGVDDSSPVGHRSSAIWGPAQGGLSMPFKVDLNAIPCVQATTFPAECNYWFDNDTVSSQWGLINLSEWDVDPDQSCSSAGTSQVRDWMASGGIETLMTNVPTYVCAEPGHRDTLWEGLSDKIGESFIFPVNDPSLVPAGANTFAIVGFTRLRIERVLEGNDPEAVGTPGVAGESARCSAVVDFDSGEVIALWTLGGARCPGGQPVDQISNVLLSERRGRSVIPYTEGVDYRYDPTLQEVTWLERREKRVRVEFNWVIQGTPATPGICGSRPSDANAICVQFIWEGPTIGGFTPGPDGMQDFGIRAIRLDKTN